MSRTPDAGPGVMPVAALARWLSAAGPTSVLLTVALLPLAGVAARADPVRAAASTAAAAVHRLVPAGAPVEKGLEVLERLTGPWAFRLVVLFAAAVLWRSGARLASTWAIATVLVGGAVALAVQLRVRRVVLPIDERELLAAGSGLSVHAMTSLLAAVVLVVVTVPRLPGVARFAAVTVALIAVAAASTSQVALGAATGVGVVAGWAAAVAVAAATAAGWALFRGRFPQPLPAGAAGQGASPAPLLADTTALLAELRGLVGRLLAWAVALVALFVVLGFAVVAAEEAVWGLAQEEALIRWLEQHRTPTWNDLTGWMSWVADTTRIELSLVIVAIVFRMLFGRWREAAFVVAAVTLEALVFVTSTTIVGRTRPQVVQLDQSPPTSSWPSGHAGAAMALYLSIALVLCWHLRRRWGRVAVVALLIIPPLCVSFSRIYRGMHFPSDVVGSLLNAALCIAVAARLVLFAALPPQLRHVLDRPDAPRRALPRAPAVLPGERRTAEGA